MKKRILSFATLCSLAAFLLLPLASNAAASHTSAVAQRSDRGSGGNVTVVVAPYTCGNTVNVLAILPLTGGANCTTGGDN